MSYSSKVKITFQRMEPYNETLQKCFMTMKQQDILENWKRTTPLDNITGGRVYVPLLRTTYKGVPQYMPAIQD